MEPIDFKHILSQMISQTLGDKQLLQELCRVQPLASHAHNSPKELEQHFLEKISHHITKGLCRYFSGSRTLFLLPIIEKKGTSLLKSVIYWRKSPPIPVGYLFSAMLLEGDLLSVAFSLEITGCEPLELVFPFPLPCLQAPANPKLLPKLSPDSQILVFIDLEWVSCYKKPSEGNQVALGQISEFSFLTQDSFYTSGYLQVNAAYLNRMHKKLLDKMGISSELMIERHSHGQSFVQAWETAFTPLLEGEKPVVLLSYGTEDRKILQKALSPSQEKRVQFIDVSGHYAIFNFGQMALLNGMGVTFTHEFSSAMDVRALYLIHQVFSHCHSQEDSRNLQLALQLHKMCLLSQDLEDKEKLEKYLSLVLANPRTQQLFHHAITLASDMVASGVFDHP